MRESKYDYRFLVESATPSHHTVLNVGQFLTFTKHGKQEQLFFDLPIHVACRGSYKTTAL